MEPLEHLGAHHLLQAKSNGSSADLLEFIFCSQDRLSENAIRKARSSGSIRTFPYSRRRRRLSAHPSSVREPMRAESFWVWLTTHLLVKCNWNHHMHTAQSAQSTRFPSSAYAWTDTVTPPTPSSLTTTYHRSPSASLNQRC